VLTVNLLGLERYWYWGI